MIKVFEYQRFTSSGCQDIEIIDLNLWEELSTKKLWAILKFFHGPDFFPPCTLPFKC